MRPKEYQSLYNAARQALKNSYSPYSKFPVGAALLTKTGQVFVGTNIENASYGLTICAERVAMFNAVSRGKRSFAAIAVAAKFPGACAPCGACRQVIFEFGQGISVVYQNESGHLLVKSIADLLPDGFGLQDLNQK